MNLRKSIKSFSHEPVIGWVISLLKSVFFQAEMVDLGMARSKDSAEFSAAEMKSFKEVWYCL